MRFHHIGVAVESLADAQTVFETLLGKPAHEVEEVPDQKVRVATFQLASGEIELLEATSPDSALARSLAKRGPGLHHLTLEVPDLAKTLRRLKERGVRLIDEEPRRGAGNTRIAFIHPSSAAGALIELVESKRRRPARKKSVR